MFGLCLFAVFISLSPADASDFSYRASVDFEGRQFEADGEAGTNDRQLSTKALLDAETEVGRFQLKLGAMGRDAYLDQDRDFFALTDTNAGFYWKDWIVSAGFHTYNWRVLELFSAVDTVNARNYDNTSEIERFGIPSLSVTREFDGSFAQLIYIPAVVPSRYPQEKNRLGLSVELDRPEFVTGDFTTSESSGRFQYILRFKKSFDFFEAHIHHWNKYDTTYPLVAVDIPENYTTDLARLEIRPYYFPARETALAFQGNLAAWMWKLEAAQTDFSDYKMATLALPAQALHLKPVDHERVAAGAERTFYYANKHSGTLYFEFIRAFADKEELPRLGAFTSDAGIGYRHSLNDFNGQQASFVWIQDLAEPMEKIFRLKHEFRFFSAWKMSSIATVIDAPKPDPNDLTDRIYGLKPVRESDNILLVISRFF